MVELKQGGKPISVEIPAGKPPRVALELLFS